MNFKIGKKVVSEEYRDCFVVEVECAHHGQLSNENFYSSFQNNEERLRDLEKVINNVRKDIENNNINKENDYAEYDFVGYKVFYYDKNGIEFEMEVEVIE